MEDKGTGLARHVFVRAQSCHANLLPSPSAPPIPSIAAGGQAVTWLQQIQHVLNGSQWMQRMLSPNYMCFKMF